MLSARAPMRRRGVTLIEIAVTLAMTAMLLMAVAPSVAQWLRDTQVRNAATSIQAGLQRARNEALRRNRTVRFTLVALADPAQMDDSCALSSQSDSWVVSFNAPAGRCGAALSDIDDPMLIEHQAGGVGGRRVDVAASVADGSASATSVAFDGFGRVSAAVAPAIGRIEIDQPNPSADDRALRIVVGSGGTIRLCEPRVGDANDPRKC